MGAGWPPPSICPSFSASACPFFNCWREMSRFDAATPCSSPPFWKQRLRHRGEIRLAVRSKRNALPERIAQLILRKLVFAFPIALVELAEVEIRLGVGSVREKLCDIGHVSP
jgi:hypothetical protein